MDGVLVESKDAWYRAFGQLGDISLEMFEREMWGGELARNLAPYGIDPGQFCKRYLSAHLSRVTTPPDLEPILNALTHPLAVITNTTRECTLQILEHVGIGSFFDGIFTSDQVEAGKPDPALVYLACESLEVDPGRCVVVGDSEEDMAAGRAAGCFTVGLGVDGDRRIERFAALPGLLASIGASENEKFRQDVRSTLSSESGCKDDDKMNDENDLGHASEYEYEYE